MEPNNPDTDEFLSGTVAADESGFPPSAFTLSTATKVSFFVDIPADAKTVDLIPEVLQPLADSVKDWNHCTLRKTLEKFDKLCPNHKKIDGTKFWSAVLRGGIQGALYVADSE